MFYPLSRLGRWLDHIGRVKGATERPLLSLSTLSRPHTVKKKANNSLASEIDVALFILPQPIENDAESGIDVQLDAPWVDRRRTQIAMYQRHCANLVSI